MFVVGESIVYSASDLAAAARCEYALLRAFDAKLGRGPAVSADDALLARTVVLGNEHERRRLDQLRDEFGDAVAVIGRPAYTLAGLTAAAEATQRAIANRAPVVYQAAMFDGRFVGFADFLVLDGEHYRVTDTKLARSPKVSALLQLAAYADALAGSGVAVAPEAELQLGDGTVVRYRVGELIPVYHCQRTLLQRLLDDHDAAGTTVRWEDQASFRPLWAHNRVDERKALTDFLAMVAKRRKHRPNMHIYHYAPYEKTALLRLAGRYGIGEDEVDELLRSGTLVDLYPLVRKSIRVGAESFSLKAGTQASSGYRCGT